MKLEKFWKKVIRRKSNFSLLLFPAILLWIIALFYRIGLFFTRLFEKEKVKVNTPLISIGNITVGGTGKTPLVALIGRFLLDEGIKVGVVSSAYGRQSENPVIEEGFNIKRMTSDEVGDEVKVLAESIPEALFSIDPVKSEAAKRLSETGKIDVIILDDGYQHFKLKRDLDIVTYDAGIKTRLLKIFPSGLLREPLKALKRAEIIIITRVKFSKDLAKLQKKLKKINPKAEHFHLSFNATKVINKESSIPIKYLEDKSVFLFAGIGNFKSLKKQVRALCADLDYAMELSDHQQYDQELLTTIKEKADQFDSDLILTTSKDWVKLENFDFGRDIYYLNQIIDMDPGEEKLAESILERLNLKKQVIDGTQL